MSDDTRAQYDRFADRYDAVFELRQQSKIIKLAAYIPRPWAGPCLDAGAGTGLASRVLNHPFVSVDVSLAMLQRASGPRVVADITRLPFRDATFGFALSVSVIDHRVDVDVAVAELHRVLRPGSHLGISLLKSEDVARAEWALKARFQRLLQRVDLGPDVGFIVQKD